MNRIRAQCHKRLILSVDLINFLKFDRIILSFIIQEIKKKIKVIGFLAMNPNSSLYFIFYIDNAYSTNFTN